MFVAWYASDVSEKEFDRLKAKLQEYTNNKASFDEHIA